MEVKPAGNQNQTRSQADAKTLSRAAKTAMQLAFLIWLIEGRKLTIRGYWPAGESARVARYLKIPLSRLSVLRKALAEGANMLAEYNEGEY